MMKSFFLLIILICFSSHLVAQETSKKPLKIKAVDDSKKPLITTTPFNISKKPTPDFKILEKKVPNNSPYDPKAKFVSSGKALEGKWTEKEKGNKIDPKYKKNQYLGDFKSNGEFVQFICRDHEYVDGDRVQILINDEIVQPNVLLQGKFIGFKFELKKGFNKVDIVALNQGSSGPNTAEFRVYDDKKNLISANLWNLATGVKATLIIVKE